MFFLTGVVKTSGSLTDVKRPEHALKLFLRFCIAKGVVTYGLELMLAIFRVDTPAPSVTVCKDLSISVSVSSGNQKQSHQGRQAPKMNLSQFGGL